MLCILKTFVAWVALLVISRNLFSAVVRGFFVQKLPTDAPSEELRAVLNKESRRMYAVDFAMTLLFAFLGAGFLFALYHFWNIGLAISAGLMMVLSLPDVLWDIQTGRTSFEKVAKEKMPKGVLHNVAFLFIILTIPIVWYSLCNWPR